MMQMGMKVINIRCNRCHKPLSDPTSVSRGFGRICWNKIQRDMLQDANRNEVRSVSNQVVADIVMNELFDRIGRKVCRCGREFQREDIWSFDHKWGLTIDGFYKPQHVYLHCSMCGYDTAYWKLRRLTNE